MRHALLFVARVVVATAALVAMEAGAAALLLPPIDAGAVPSMGPVLLSRAMAAGMLLWIARRATWRGWPLAAGLFAIHFGVASFANLIEALAFDILPAAHVVGLIGMAALAAAAFAPVAVLIAGRFRTAESSATPLAPRTSRQFALRLAAGSLVYLVLYFAAGTVIFPYVQEFYEAIGLPSTAAVVALQLFVRGPLFVGLCVLAVLMTAGTRLERAVRAGAMMAILGGVAPLIIPNPYLPDAVRWIHMAEVVPSNFLFGLIAGWMFAGPSLRDPSRQTATPPPGAVVRG